MNENIKRIADQMFAKDESGDLAEIVPYAFMVQYAELIVKECAELATKEYNQRGAIHGDDLKNYFGIE